VSRNGATSKPLRALIACGNLPSMAFNLRDLILTLARSSKPDASFRSSMMPSKARFCAVCGLRAEFSCASCHSASYCSEVCQRKDWALHSLLCKEYGAWLDLRPSDAEFSTFKLGLLFPVDSKYPKFIWIECELQIDDRHHQEIDIPRRYLPGEIECFRKHWRDHSIELWMEQDPKVEGNHHAAELNRCLRNLLKGYETRDRSCSIAYRSPVLVVSYTQQFDEFNARSYQDVTLADLRHTLNFFARNIVMFEAKWDNPYVVRYGTTWVKAAKINCDGDIFTRGVERYTQVEIRRDYSIFDHNSEVCQISKQMGIPLRVQKCGIGLSWKDATFNPFLNCAVEPMMLPAGSDVWCLEGRTAPSYQSRTHRISLRSDADVFITTDSSPWLGDVAQTVLVARQDKMDFTAQQLEVFARYCGELVAPAMLGPTGLADHLDEEGRQGVVKRYMCRELFDVFLLEVKNSARAKGLTNWEDVISPYLSPYVIWESKGKPAENDVRYSVAPPDLYFDGDRPAEIELDYG